MTIQSIIKLIVCFLIIIVFVSYMMYIWAYSEGFEEGLNMGKKIEKYDRDKTESEV